MKRLLPMASAWIVLAVFAAGSRAADAPVQTPMAAGLDPVKIVQNLREAIGALDLSDDQKTQVTPILDKADEQAKTLADKMADLDPREKIALIGPFIRNLREQLSKVLNPDQMKALEAKLNLAPRAGGPLMALQASLAKLDLSDDQKKQLADVMQEVRQKGLDLRQKAQNGQDVRDEVQQIRQDTMQKLAGILKPDQQQQLRDLMQQNGAPQNAPQTQPDTPTNKPYDMDNTDGMAPTKVVEKSSADGNARDEKDLTAVAGPDVGAPEPDIQIEMGTGHPAALSSFKGHVVVIELGSLSSPTFRDRAAGIEKLKSDIGMGAYFALIYTREAYPSGDKQIERNKTDKMEIAQPATLEARKAVAERAVTLLHTSLPLTVDDMEDHLVNALGGYPNGCIVIGKDGRIAGRQRWIEPVALKRMIEDAEK